MTNETSKAALRIRNIAVILLVLMPLSALGSRFGLWPYTVGLLLFSVSMLGCLLIQIINAIWLLRKPASGTKSALRWASLFALPPLILIATLMRGDEGTRAGIHNISTDLVNPPHFVKAIEQRGSDSNPLEYSEEIAIIQRKAFPDVETINTTLNTKEAFSQAVATAKKLGWSIYSEDADNGIIEAVETTFWFGFKDDIVIRVETHANGSKIDLRSVSRVGRGDMGANAKRILAFTDAYSAQ